MDIGLFPGFRNMSNATMNIVVEIFVGKYLRVEMPNQEVGANWQLFSNCSIQR